MNRSPADFVRTLLRIERDGLTGVLGARTEEVSAVIYVREGAPVFASGGATDDTLGRTLLADGKISREALDKALARMAGDGAKPEDREMRLGELLVVMGQLTLEEVREALAEQVKRKIERCLAFNTMGLSFDPKDALPDHIGRFPCAVAPCVLRGARQHYDERRASHYLRALNDAFLTAGRDPGAVAERFGATPAEEAVIASLDGSRPLGRVIETHLRGGRNPYPVLVALVLAAQVGASKTPTARSSRPEAGHDARAMRTTLPQQTMRSDPPAAARAMRTTLPQQTMRTDPPAAAPRATSSQPTTTRKDPRAVRAAARPSSPSTGVRSRSSAPSLRSSSSGRISAPTSDRSPLRSSQPGLGSDAPPLSEPPGRISGIGINAISEAPGPASQPRPVSLRPAAEKQQLSSLQAERSFQRGLRHLRADQFERAAEDLAQAAEARADSLEYQLYAKWAAYRACKVEGELGYLRSELDPIARLLAKQDRAHGLPPYVLAHLALAAADEERALTLFKMAVKRDPKNRDAERHVRLLTTRRGDSSKKA